MNKPIRWEHWSSVGICDTDELNTSASLCMLYKTDFPTLSYVPQLVECLPFYELLYTSNLEKVPPDGTSSLLGGFVIEEC